MVRKRYYESMDKNALKDLLKSIEPFIFPFAVLFLLAAIVLLGKFLLNLVIIIGVGIADLCSWLRNKWPWI